MGDGYNMNGLEYAIERKKIDIIQYLFSFDDIQKEYAPNKELTWRCAWYMSRWYDESVASYLMKILDLNEERLRELQKFKCAQPDDYEPYDDEFGYYYKYWNETIDDDDINLLLNGKN